MSKHLSVVEERRSANDETTRIHVCMFLLHIVCWAMNRSVTNVLFGAFGASAIADSGTTMAGQTVNPIQADEAAIILAYAHLVIVVPGTAWQSPRRNTRCASKPV
jgi:hypothetical protein